GGNLNGATTASLKMVNVVEGDSGNYSLGVTNAYGFTVSSNATLLVSALDHFAWDHIPSPQSMNVPFMVTLRARDASHSTVTNYHGGAGLSAADAGVALGSSVNFVQGTWTGSIVVTQALSNLLLRAEDALGHAGLANPIQVIPAPELQTESYGNVLLLM